MPKASSSGHALALLLWMITGMSLMVAAVIHVARDDIGMAEQRLNEAKSRAMARGLAFLASRDSAVQQGESQSSEDDPSGGDASESETDQSNKANAFRKQYEMDGMIGAVEILPAEAFVSLNTATEEELFRLFLVIGQAEPDAAYEMALSVIGYRDQPRHAIQEIKTFSGFTYREELLAVNGMRRSVYDRVKDLVHVNTTAGLDVDQAPAGLAAIYADDSDASDESGRPGYAFEGEVKSKPPAMSRQVQGPITFESIYRHKAAMLRGSSVRAVMVKAELPNGHRANLRVWIDQDGKQISRVEKLAMQPEKI